MQVHDVIENGYWHARSQAYTATPLARTLEWLRMPGDLVFMFAGALPLALALTWGYLSRSGKETAGIPQGDASTPSRSVTAEV